MSLPLSPEARDALKPYVSNLDEPVFALQNLPEEVMAVLFAYYSRSQESLRENLARLLNDQALGMAPVQREAAQELTGAQAKASAFHEKWVLGYGHASVAEHAVAHLAVEDVSILASKVLEDARLASFTEKSTRYVVFDRDRFLRPRAIMASRHAALFEETARHLFDTYASLQAPLQSRLASLYPAAPAQRPGPYQAALKAKSLDILRALLPAATLTNLGMTLNGRSLEHLLSRLLSHPLEEVRALGVRLKREGLKVLPTLVRHAEPNRYRATTADALDALSDVYFRDVEPRPARSAVLVRYDPEGELELAATLLYPYTRAPLNQLRETLRQLSPAQREEMLEEALKRRGPHDGVLRELEHIHYTFDLLVDFGAWRDIQRHRMVTQTPQALTVEHGYELPEELELLDLAEPFEDAMDRAAHCFQAMVGSLPHEAAYVVPLAYRRRLLFTWNLREIFHFVELRSSIQGHRSYRRLAQEIYRLVAQVHPFVARFIRVCWDDVGLERLKSEENRPV